MCSEGPNQPSINLYTNLTDIHTPVTSHTQADFGVSKTFASSNRASMTGMIGTIVSAKLGGSTPTRALLSLAHSHDPPTQAFMPPEGMRDFGDTTRGDNAHHGV